MLPSQKHRIFQVRPEKVTSIPLIKYLSKWKGQVSNVKCCKTCHNVTIFYWDVLPLLIYVHSETKIGLDLCTQIACKLQLQCTPSVPK